MLIMLESELYHDKAVEVALSGTTLIFNLEVSYIAKFRSSSATIMSVTGISSFTFTVTVFATPLPSVASTLIRAVPTFKPVTIPVSETETMSGDSLVHFIAL